MGIGSTLFLFLVSLGLRQTLKPQEHQRVVPGDAASPFQEDRVWADVSYLTNLGPRPSGSPAMKKQQNFILQSLERAGLKARQQHFVAETPQGPVEMTTIWGLVTGTMPGVIILGTHYETIHLPDASFVGANDGAATTAWMLEMARILGPRREGRSLWLTFFDGDDCPVGRPPSETRYGSRNMLAELTKSDDLSTIDAVITVSMIGDCYLAISRDDGAPDWISEIIMNTARRYDYDGHFSDAPGNGGSTGSPFAEAGIPTLELADWRYGGSQLEHRQNWHTPADTLEKVCASSLRAVGDVIYHAIPVVDGQLDAIR